MATLTNVTDNTKDKEGNEIKNLKYFGEGDQQISENAHITWSPLPFESFGKIMRTTNRALATAVKEYYQKTFHDLRGVNLRYVPGLQAPFVFEFFFAKNSMPKPDGKIYNLKDLTIPAKGDNLYTKKQVLDNKVVGKQYTLNDETKLLLSDIMYGGKNANNPKNGRWNNYITDFWNQTNDWTFNPNAGEFLVRVTGCFDIHRILQKLYGNSMVVKTEKVENGDRNLSSTAAYEVRFIKYAFNEPNIFIMNVEQFDKSAVEEITIKENPIIRTTANGFTYF